jgi:N-acetylated-alpha-linked acidic dipeptidase
VDLQPVLDQLAKIDADSKAFEAAISGSASQADRARLAQVNEALIETERVLTLSKGLPGRDWYRHQIYAPGLYTGYGVKTLPGIREAVEGERWDEASRETQDVAQVLGHLDQRIEDATRLLTSP